MKHLLEKYLHYLNEFMPAAGIMPVGQPAGYKQAPGPINNIEDEKDIKETSYNPDGSGYGMMLQRWAYTQGNPAARGIDSTITNPNQKSVNKKIKITVTDDEENKNEKDDDS